KLTGFTEPAGRQGFSSHPLWISSRSVEHGGGLERFEFASHGSIFGFCQQSGHLCGSEGAKTLDNFYRLIEALRTFAACDYHRSWEAQGIMQTLFGCHGAALEHVAIPHRFHAEYGNALLD